MPRAIIFGGPMSANDSDDFIRREIDWLAVPLREKKPFLGICLGAQMLAHHLGSRVFRHPDGHAEVGYYPIRPTDIGRAVCDPWPEQVYQWHREGFDLPLGAELLAEGDSFPVQAFRYGGAAFALQFHPDVTHAMMCRWTTRGHERMLLPNAKPRVAHFADRAVYDPAGRAWLAAFLNHWLGPPAAAARRRPAAAGGCSSSHVFCRFKAVDVAERRKGAHPEQHHQQDADAADEDRGNGAEPCRHQAGAEIAELIGGAGEQRVDGVDAAAHLVRRLELDQRHPDHHAHRVGRRRGSPAPPIDSANDVDSANTMVASPKQATLTNMMRPICRVSGQRVSTIMISSAPTAGAARSKPRPLRADVEDLVGEDRQQRRRAAEQHREQVERDDAEHDRVASDIGDAGEERRQADRRARRRAAFDAHEGEQDHRCEEERGADRVGDGRAEDVEKSAERRPGDGGKLGRRCGRRDRARKQRQRHHRRQQGLLGRRLEGPRRCRRRRRWPG